MNEQMMNEYLNGLLSRFNEDPNHPDLSVAEKALLGRVRDIRKGISETEEQMKTLQTEINERQQKLATFNQQVVFNQGAVQGLVDALVSLRVGG